MNLYLLLASETDPLWSPWYDKAFGFVVVAKDEESARRLASANCGCEGTKAWLSAEHSVCELLGTTERTEPTVVLRDFASG